MARFWIVGWGNLFYGSNAGNPAVASDVAECSWSQTPPHAECSLIWLSSHAVPMASCSFTNEAGGTARIWRCLPQYAPNLDPQKEPAVPPTAEIDRIVAVEKDDMMIISAFSSLTRSIYLSRFNSHVGLGEREGRYGIT